MSDYTLVSAAVLSTDLALASQFNNLRTDAIAHKHSGGSTPVVGMLNAKYVTGETSGGVAKNLLGVDASNVLQIGASGLTINMPVGLTIGSGGLTVSNGGVIVTLGGLSVQGGTTSLASGLTFTGTGARITGDLSTATAGNRVLFQSSTVDGSTNLGVIPNGASLIAQLVAYNAADPNNAGRVQVGVSGTSARVLTAVTGAGTEPATIDLGSALGTILSLATATGLSTFSYGVNVASGKNLQIGGAAARGTTEPTNAINLFNGTAPVGTLANGATFYAAAGEMRVMDASGNSTLLSPHDEANLWVFDSVDTTTGKHLRIDVERLLRFLNAHHGLDCVRED